MFDRTPEGMAGIGAKSAFWLCHFYGVECPGWLKALFFQRGDSATKMNYEKLRPGGLRPGGLHPKNNGEQKGKGSVAGLA